MNKESCALKLVDEIIPPLNTLKFRKAQKVTVDCHLGGCEFINSQVCLKIFFVKGLKLLCQTQTNL